MSLKGIILAFLSLAVLYRPGALAAASFGPEFLGPPAVVLKWNADLKTPRKIVLAGARNEHLFVPLIIENHVGPLKIRLEGAAPFLNVRAFRALTAPPVAAGQLPPDVLLPLEDEPSHVSQPLTLWVSLKILPGYPSGRHQLSLCLSDGAREARLPVELRVYRFSLPEDLPVTLFAGVWYQRGFGPMGPPGLAGGSPDLIKEYYRRLRDYKFNALGGSYPLPLNRLGSGERLEEQGVYHELLSFALNDLKFRYVQMPTVKGWKGAADPESPFCRQARQFYPLFVEYLRRHGWVDRALNYLVDEPSPEQSLLVKQAFALARSLAPGIKNLCAGWGEPSRLAGVVDIWAYQAANYREEERARAQAQGQEAWLYINRLHTLGQPLAHPRLIGWLLFHYRFSGYLLWGVNFWPQNPWSTAPGPWDFYRRGAFLYPHPQTGRPLASLRLEALRRGFQDYQYFQLVEEQRRRGGVREEQARALFTRIADITKNLPTNSFPVTMAELEEIRQQAGEVLDGALAVEAVSQP